MMSIESEREKSNHHINDLNPDTPHAADPEFEEQQPGVIDGDRKTDQDQWRHCLLYTSPSPRDS